MFPSPVLSSGLFHKVIPRSRRSINKRQAYVNQIEDFLSTYRLRKWNYTRWQHKHQPDESHIICSNVEKTKAEEQIQAMNEQVKIARKQAALKLRKEQELARIKYMEEETAKILDEMEKVRQGE